VKLRARFGVGAIVLSLGMGWPLAATTLDRRQLYEDAARGTAAMLEEARAAHQRARAAGDKPARLLALRRSAFARQMSSDYTGLQADLAMALPLARELGDREAECDLIGYEAPLLGRNGDNTAAVAAALDRGIELCARWGQRALAGVMHLRKGSMYDSKGQVSEAVASFQAAYALFESAVDRLGMGTALTLLGSAHSGDPDDRAETDRAIEYFERALATDGNALDRGYAAVRLAWIHARRKDAARATQFLEQRFAIKPRESQFEARDSIRIMVAELEQRYGDALALIELGQTHHAGP
jgi:tetratricopeptide (TPR) repeat protein